MIFNKANLLALAAIATAVLTACDSSPTSPAGTSAAARTDLQAMADKVKYFSPENPASSRSMNAAGKRAATDPASACDLEATTYETWNTDTTLTEGVTTQYDTTVSYTSAGQPICALEDQTAYQITRSRSDNSMLETNMNLRMDFPSDFVTGEFKMSGTGTVNYKDGYLINITSIDVVIDLATGSMKTYALYLALEKGYTAVLGVAPGINLMDDTQPSAEAVQVSGPISKDGVVVGYFEVMGDDRVIIRDTDKAIIESHG